MLYLYQTAIRLEDWREGAATEIFTIKGIAQMLGQKYDSIHFVSCFLNKSGKQILRVP